VSLEFMPQLVVELGLFGKAHVLYLRNPLENHAGD